MENVLLQASLYLAAAVIAVPISKRLGLGSVLGYLLAGIFLSPFLHLIGSDTEQIQHYAEFGIVILLFLIGLEMRPRRIWEMRESLIGLGGSQIFITTSIITFIATTLGLPWQSSLAIAIILSLSSTAIVLQTLTEKKLQHTEGGKSATAILLMQDVAVIPILAILPLLGIGGMQLFQAESPGPTADKLTPRVQETAKLLWVVYLALTALEFMLLWLHPSMNWFDALNHAFTSLASGGFSTKDTSIAAFDSVYIDVIITLFMFLSGVNFAMHFRLLKGDLGTFFNNRETRFYTLVTVIGIFIITFSLWYFDGRTLLEALRYGSFQVVAIITTTGYVTDDYELWYTFGASVLLLFFFTGASAGSTSGGLKMARWMILIRNLGREIKQIIHPRAIIPIRIGDHAIEPSIQRTVLSFFILYILIFGFGVILISLFGYDLMSSIGASISALGNVGPAWGEFGPTDNFATLPYAAKWVLIILMMIGRLELFTVIILFSPSFWKQ